MLKPLLSGRCTLYLNETSPTVLYELILKAKEKGCKSIVTTDVWVLYLLTKDNKASIDNYAGSIFESHGCEILILHPLEHLVTVPYGKFLYERYFSKFLQPTNWLQIPEFKWELFEPEKQRRLLTLCQGATFISLDIETSKTERGTITCLGVSAVHLSVSSRELEVTTFVIPLTSDYNVAVARQICSLPAPKVFQNGKYDNAYLLRYNIIVINWAFDTAHLFHSWYSELPKRLDFIASFIIRKWIYWKDEAQTADLKQYYEYNAKDAFITGMEWIALLLEVPAWAISNYLMEFPVVFPCLLCELTGIKQDEVARVKLATKVETSFNEERRSIGVMVGNKDFNPGSWQQTQQLFEILGSGDIKKTGKIERDRVMNRHPLNKIILSKIGKYRGDRKLFGSYVGKEAAWLGRIYYSLNPHGTDTGRLASKESAFWCGLQIQNIPTDKPDIQIKETFVADEGFLFGEADYRQNEAYGTAFQSGDTNLIAAVLDPTKDFHGRNAAKFFGIPYEKIVNSFQNEVGEWVHKTVDKLIRDLSKRTNHGANYNIGPQVLVDTMGIQNVLQAKKLLNLPRHWSLTQVTGYLLARYAETYPVVKGGWYDKNINDVVERKMLIGPTGWVRYCFSDPKKNKHAFNSYVAHHPQSLAAMLLNKAFRRIFYEVWMPNAKNFKLIAQIHDSIPFMYREGHEHLAWQVKECMEFETPIKDIFNITRIMKVPVDLKGGARRWSEIESIKHK